MIERKNENGPWRITFDTNPDDCNLQCIMCEEFSEFSQRQSKRLLERRPPRRMDEKLIRKVIEEASQHGLKEIIPSTMGEPLLYERFEYILSLCHEFNVKLNLTTNGTFPQKTVTEWARLIVPVTSDVKISWNGSTPETAEAIMKGIRFEKIIDNVKEFIRVRDEVASSGGNRCRITFQITFLETNINELPQVIKLASELGVDRVKGHHLWVHFDQIQHLSMRRSPEVITRWNQAVDCSIVAAERYRLPSGKKILLENIFHLDPSTAEISQAAICPFLGKEAWVSAQGCFNPCCAPDELRQTLGEFGNLKEKSLMDIWTGPSYKKLTETYLTNSLCRTCNMRQPLKIHWEATS